MPEYHIWGENVAMARYRALDAFTQGYIEAAFFADCPADENWTLDMISEEEFAAIEEHCAEFQDRNRIVLESVYSKGYNESKAGRDYWFTRQGHGSGYWDGDCPEPEASKLVNASMMAGQVFPYLGDDGFIYELV